MDAITFFEREMTNAELEQMKAGFIENAAEFGNPAEASERYGFVVMAGENFIGCASGLTDKNKKWFFLSDLFIEKEYRGQGLGAAILAKLEQRVTALGIRNIWTWTAGYEAPGFYQKQGYEIFTELEDWYLSGHSRVGLRKRLESD
jgi:GNAT superfamily N-acetyltransferase